MSLSPDILSSLLSSGVGQGLAGGGAQDTGPSVDPTAIVSQDTQDAARKRALVMQLLRAQSTPQGPNPQGIGPQDLQPAPPLGAPDPVSSLLSDGAQGLGGGLLGAVGGSSALGEPPPAPAGSALNPPEPTGAPPGTPEPTTPKVPAPDTFNQLLMNYQDINKQVQALAQQVQQPIDFKALVRSKLGDQEDYVRQQVQQYVPNGKLGRAAVFLTQILGGLTNQPSFYAKIAANANTKYEAAIKDIATETASQRQNQVLQLNALKEQQSQMLPVIQKQMEAENQVSQRQDMLKYIDHTDWDGVQMANFLTTGKPPEPQFKSTSGFQIGSNILQNDPNAKDASGQYIVPTATYRLGRLAGKLTYQRDDTAKFQKIGVNSQGQEEFLRLDPTGRAVGTMVMGGQAEGLVPKSTVSKTVDPFGNVETTTRQIGPSSLAPSPTPSAGGLLQGNIPWNSSVKQAYDNWVAGGGAPQGQALKAVQAYAMHSGLPLPSALTAKGVSDLNQVDQVLAQIADAQKIMESKGLDKDTSWSTYPDYLNYSKFGGGIGGGSDLQDLWTKLNFEGFRSGAAAMQGTNVRAFKFIKDAMAHTPRPDLEVNPLAAEGMHVPDTPAQMYGKVQSMKENLTKAREIILQDEVKSGVPHAPSSQTGIPKVGEMYQGHKVLKVEKVP